MKYQFWYLILLVAFFSENANSQTNTTARPNIILVIADDLRYDSFGPTGAPEWFDVPSINRIAEEGATFKNYYCVYSLCVPSRSSIMTGLYPHSNGAYSNMNGYFPGLPTIATILDSAGYHTAMIGKYHAYFEPQPGWDYWMAKTGETDYTDALYDYNGVLKVIPGYTTQVINDSSYKIISTIDTPFLVSIEHQAPHKPVVPLPEDNGVYSNEPMPIPDNFSPYLYLYPSFIYERSHYTDTMQLVHDFEKYFEGLRGIDANVSQIFDALTSRNLLDNTIILFTGDNGMMYGEHLIGGKGVAYDPSMKLPMFIRYPAWFEPNTVVSKVMGLHVDIAPTLLEAAGINEAPYHFEGISLHKLATGSAKRNMVLYENIKLGSANQNDDDAISPSIRTLRTFHYKYSRYQCTGTTEEFFNLQTDPEENFNQIYNPVYQNLIDLYRYTLDSLRIALHDTLSIDTFKKDCYLVHEGHQYLQSYPVENPFLFSKISPNPFKENIDVTIFSEEEGDVEVTLYNEIGQALLSRTLQSNGESQKISFSGSGLSPGIYLIKILQGDKMSAQFVFKE